MAIFSYMTGKYGEFDPSKDFTRKYVWSLIGMRSSDKAILVNSTGIAMIDFNDICDADDKISRIILESHDLEDCENSYWKNVPKSTNAKGIYNATLALYDPDTDEDLIEYKLKFIPVSVIKESDCIMLSKEGDF